MILIDLSSNCIIIYKCEKFSNFWKLLYDVEFESRSIIMYVELKRESSITYPVSFHMTPKHHMFKRSRKLHPRGFFSEKFQNHVKSLMLGKISIF